MHCAGVRKVFDPTVNDVPSPCVGICELDAASGLCRGCVRTLEEIATWSTLTPAQKRAVLRAVDERRDRARDASSR